MKKVRLGSRAKKAFQGRSRGFTLVEVLITIALIGAISVAFFSFMSAATSFLIHADERTIAESLARSQLEFAKNQGYNSTATYIKIPSASIPVGYTIWSVSSSNQTQPVNGGASDPIIGIAWDSTDNKPATTDKGLQMIALVIEHDGKEIYTFIDNNSAWHTGSVKITLEGYIRGS
jgi:prepilin-type N-terminal cleavage/methylation domain-containing protein